MRSRRDPQRRACSSTASPKTSSSALRGSPHSSDSARQKTSPPSSPSSPGQMAAGSTVRRCVLTAESSESRNACACGLPISTHQRNQVMKQVIVITGASSGFGALAARALARSGHIVYAGMRGTESRNALQVENARRYATEHNVDLRTVELDVQSDRSVVAAIDSIVGDCGRLDVVIHNAGHMSFGPAEAFTPEQFAELYDINVLSTQRVNRAALPQLRKQGRGMVLSISSSSARGGTPPYLSPYFAAKAAMDSLAVSYAGELARWGIETTIIVPGAFTKGTNHFAHSGSPADAPRAAEYANGPTADIPETAMKGLA